MADDLNIRGSVDIQTSAARRAMNALAREIESYNKLTDKSSASARAQRAGIKQLSDTVNMLTQNLAKAEAAQKKLNATSTGSTVRAPQTSTPVADAGLNVSDRAMSQAAKYRVDQQTELNAKKQQEAAINQRLETESRAALNNARAATESVKQRVALENAAAAAARRSADAAEKHTQQLNGMRYALYDVSRTATVSFAALTALAVAPFAIAVQWERDFANVQRTVGGTSEEIKALKQDFVGLAQTIPESWEELTNIGTLAGQLGIAREQVTAFTGVVAKFSATTDVSTNDAATAFGRLDNILLDSSGNFEGLASSVLRVGVNSVATESQILKISTQIASTAKLAGFTADEVIGLSGALASLGVPPELSRGVITRVFGQISRAISEGGTNLQRFGQLAGTSGTEFAAAWNADAAGTFQQLLAGIKSEGPAAEAAIRSLGITSVRDVPVLLRLANSGTVVADAFRDAAIGMKDASELGDQYAIIASTIDSKIKILGNSLQALGDAVGSGGLPIIGSLLDAINERLAQFTDFANTDAGRWVTSIGLIVVAVGALLSAVVAIGSISLAGYAALITAMVGLQTSAGGAAISFGSMNAMLAATGPLGAKAATAIRLLGTALKAASVIGLVLAFPDVVGWAREGLDTLKGWENTYAATMKRVTEVNSDYASGLSNINADAPIAAVAKMNDFLRGSSRLFANANLSWDASINEVKKLDDQLAQLAANGSVQDLRDKFQELRDATPELTFKQLMDTLPALRDSMTAAGLSFGTGADGAVTLTGAATGTTAAVEQLTEAEEEANQATQDLLDTFASADASFIDIGTIYDSMIEANKKLAQDTADDTLENASDSWQDYFDGFTINVDEYLANLQKMVDAQNNWEKNLLTLKAAGASDEVLSELSKLGVEGAPLVQQFVDGLVNGTGQLDTFTEILGQKGTDATTAFATALQTAGPAFWAEAGKLGDGAVQEIIAKLASGQSTVEQIVKDYNLDLEFGISPVVDPAKQQIAQQTLIDLAKEQGVDYNPSVLEVPSATVQAALDALAKARDAKYSPQTVETAKAAVAAALAELAATRNPLINPVGSSSFSVIENALNDLARDRYTSVIASFRVDGAIPPGIARPPGTYNGGLVGEVHGLPGFAGGGLVGGARAAQRYQDTLVATLRPREFVVQEDAVDHYGKGFFNALNNRALDTSDFMRPVPVAQRRSNGGGPQLVELVASDKALLASRAGSGVAVVTFAPSEAAAAASKGNTSNFKKGGN
jgi:TP901 family phage tail tape measure protein